MALDSNQRYIKLIVTEVEVNLLEAKWREETNGDLVEIEFRGKLLPSSKQRIEKALLAGDFDLTASTLV